MSARTPSEDKGIRKFFTRSKRKDRASSTGEGAVRTESKKTRKTSETEDAGVRKSLSMDLESEMDQNRDQGQHTEEEEEARSYDSIWDEFDQRLKNTEKQFDSFKEDTLKSVRGIVKKLTTRVNDLEERVTKCEKKLKDRSVSGCNCADDIKGLKIELNRLHQYSCKDNIGIHGLKQEDADENSKKVVQAFLKDKLGVELDIRDFAAAHRLPGTSKPARKGKPKKPPQIIARLKDRSDKAEIITNRRKLKGTGISITEDITRENLKLIEEAEKSKNYEAVWFSNGKVRAKLKGGVNKIRNLQIFDEFE